MASIVVDNGRIEPQEQASRTSKAMKLARKKSQPGEIFLPTPVIRRARGHQLSSPLQQPCWSGPATDGDGKKSLSTTRGPRNLSIVSELESELQTLRNRTSPAVLSLYEALLRALHSLLTATTEPSAKSRANKSLMAMCLRKLPEYIDELEYWEQHDAEEHGTKSTLLDSAVSSEIYEEVVAILPPAHNGCPQLRQLVRAHGLKLIKNAVAEDLFDQQFAVSLVKLCSKMKAYPEAEGLLETLLNLDVASSGNAASKSKDTVYPRPKCMGSTFEEGRKLAPLKALRDFAKVSERPQFMLGQISSLMSKQKLPLEWLATKEFAAIWSGIVKTLSRKGVCDAAVSFAIHTITMLASQARKQEFSLKPEPNDARILSQQTLISTITTVATLPLLRCDAASSLPHSIRQDDTSVTSQRVQYIIRSCIYLMRRRRKPTWITTVLDLSAFYASISHNDSSATTEAMSLILNNQKSDIVARQHREAATALICTLAQSMGRGAPEASHNSLTTLLDRLDTALQGEMTIPRSLRSDCAFFLAERTLDLRDLAFAESFNNNETGDVELGVKTTLRHPASSPSVKFRWDEGIAEWVTATPAVAKRQQPRRRSLRSRSSRAGIETCQDGGAESGNGVFNGFSDDEAASDDSAKHLARKRTLKRRRSGMPVAGRRKQRKMAATYHPSLQSEDDGEDNGDEEESCNGKVTQNGRTRHGQENEGDNSSSGRAFKKRRTVALKPYRSILKTMSNTGGAELSEDELGL